MATSSHLGETGQQGRVWATQCIHAVSGTVPRALASPRVSHRAATGMLLDRNREDRHWSENLRLFFLFNFKCVQPGVL